MTERLQGDRVIISRRACKLFGRAFSVGVDPLIINDVLKFAVDDVRSKRKKEVTRGDLKFFESEVRTQIANNWINKNTTT